MQPAVVYPLTTRLPQIHLDDEFGQSHLPVVGEHTCCFSIIPVDMLTHICMGNCMNQTAPFFS